MRILALLCALAFAVPAAGRAQGTATVPVDDPLYRDVDRVIDAGVVTHVIVGQRPYSRRTMARIAREARAMLSNSLSGPGVFHALERDATERLLAALAPEVSELDGERALVGDVQWSMLRSVRLDGLATDAPTRAVPPNGLGAIEADLNTLTDNRQGRQLVPGVNLALESEHAVQLPAGVSFQARPRLLLFRGRAPGGSGVLGELLAANVRAVRDNVAVTVGREFTTWETTGGTALFFGNNAPALDMVRIATDAPVLLPSMFGRLGLLAATLQVADLGRSDSSSHSRLVSYKVSVKPASALEVGATFENHFGGTGAPGTSALNRFIDLVPILDIFRHHIDSTDVQSDKLLGADARLRLAALGNITLFGELALEDFDIHRLKSIFTEDAAYTGGIIVPSLFMRSLSMRAGYHTVGLRFYEHHLLRNGIAAHRYTLGDDLGRDATGVFATVHADCLREWSVAAETAVDVRRNDQYVGSYTGADRTGLVFTKVSSAPAERRARFLATVRWSPRSLGMMTELRTGAERTTNPDFTSAPARTNAVVSATVAWYR